jgi:hypothetical protein
VQLYLCPPYMPIMDGLEQHNTLNWPCLENQGIRIKLSIVHKVETYFTDTVILASVTINPLKMKRRLLYLKTPVPTAL